MSAATILACAITFVPAAQAETMKQALGAAYYFNPALDAARARLRSIDEGVTQARGGFRPNISAAGSVDAENERSRATGAARTNATTKTSAASLTLTQSIFRGFRTINEVRQAEAAVRAGRAELEAAEQILFFAVAQAYANVFYNREAVILRRQAVSNANKRLRVVNKRFAEEDVTKTDIDQTKLTKAEAEEDLVVALADLRTSETNFQRLVGRKPGRLQTPWYPGRLIPKRRSHLIAVALEENPLIIQSLYTEQTGRLAVDIVRGELLPTLSATSSISTLRSRVSSTTTRTHNASVSLNLLVPIYQGGIVHSQVRQAKQNHIASIQEVKSSRDLVREAAHASWIQLQTAGRRINIVGRRSQLLRRVLAGVTAEERIGQRTILDVLDAQVALNDARVDLVTEKRNRIISAFNTLNAAGRLTASRLAISKRIYDPSVHYHRVRRKAFGTSITRNRSPGARTERTARSWKTSVRKR